ncbi:flagellar protein FliO/FliZ [Phorcysia thermohydrogeniphila]|uniref:Flagellar protein FliO/FliZ n=1 Tax=Phorcysia thermohydrogeniphila TaxID=936138 RepID=A0A4R1GBK5_9BACT|nr:flagellar protein FliO/FliZ [Phorcysia thermohydrogeniphila]
MYDVNLWKFLFSSAAVIGLLLVVYYFVNRLGVAFPSRRGAQLIELLDYRPIDRDRGFLLVRVRGREFFLAYDRGGIYLLKDWKKNEEDVISDSPTGNCS